MWNGMVTYEWAEKLRSYWNFGIYEKWMSRHNLIWSIFSDRITYAPWRLKVRKHVGSWSLGVTLCWVTVRSEWMTNCARGGMDAALGLDAIVAPTAASEEGSWVTVKNKGRCIWRKYNILFLLNWITWICLMCYTIRRQRAVFAWFGGSRLEGKHKSFILSKRNFKFHFFMSVTSPSE